MRLGIDLSTASSSLPGGFKLTHYREGSICRNGSPWVACVPSSQPAVDTSGLSGRLEPRPKHWNYYANYTTRLVLPLPGGRGVPIATFLDEWLAHVLPVRNVSTSTVGKYTTVLQTHVYRVIRRRTLGKLPAEYVNAFSEEWPMR